ncbi:MAG: energy transducer TonB [Bacteroidales bacterium]
MKTIKVLFILLVILSIKANAQKTDTSISKKTDVVLIIVEVMPLYPGGEEAMFKFIGDNTIYPIIAKEKGVSGTVIVTFVVEKDGSISNVNLLKDIGGGCGEEAVRVVKAMPRWIPGKQNGVNIRVQYNLPIRFTLGNEKEQKKTKKKQK